MTQVRITSTVEILYPNCLDCGAPLVGDSFADTENLQIVGACGCFSKKRVIKKKISPSLASPNGSRYATKSKSVATRPTFGEGEGKRMDGRKAYNPETYAKKAVAGKRGSGDSAMGAKKPKDADQTQSRIDAIVAKAQTNGTSSLHFEFIHYGISGSKLG